MYDTEIRLLRKLLEVYDGWPHNVDCISIADTLRSAISALERLGEMELRAAESQ